MEALTNPLECACDPEILLSDLPEIADSLKEAIATLEEAWKRSKLESHLAMNNLYYILGDEIIKEYQSLYQTRARPTPLRRRLLTRVVESGLAYISAPLVSYPVWALFRETTDVHQLDERSPGTITESPAPFGFLLRSGSGKHILHPGTRFSARIWGIEFMPASRKEINRLALQLISRAQSEIAKGLSALKRIDRLNPPQNKIRFRLGSGCDGDGLEFEQLVVDILNLGPCFARLAPLDEDILEKTDVRVQYPDIKRQRGVRVQVFLAASEQSYQKKVGGLIYKDEFVLLSPYSLALTLKEHSKTQEFHSFNLESFWEIIPGSVADVEELAAKIRAIFVAALAAKLTHPEGPAVVVPEPLRHLLQLSCELQAHAAQSALRAREAVKGTRGYRYRKGR